MSKLTDKNRKHLQRKKRIRKKISGTAENPRLSVFKSNRSFYAQAVDDIRGLTLASVSSLEKGSKDRNVTVDRGSELGKVLGARLKEKKIARVVFDRNGYLYHGVVQAFAEGVRETGIQF